MDTEISMIGGAVKTQIYGKRHRCPCWILCAAIEADLPPNISKGGMKRASELEIRGLTLFAGFVLSLSNMFLDSALLASTAIICTKVCEAAKK